MAPKRAKRNVGKRGSAHMEVDYDASKFVSKEAEEEYARLRAKPIAKERGFKPSYRDGEIESMIAERGWWEFCEEPIAVPMGIVREFYANARMEKNGYSYVRGKIVDYQPQAIRVLFQQLPQPEGVQDWVIMPHADVDLNALVAQLCVPGSDWKRSVGGTDPVTFLAKDMNRYARAWNLFICARLLPTSHTHEVTVERAILLWGILRGEYIDLGYLLYSSMISFMQGGTSAAIPHASVVALLCQAAGIEWGVEEQVQYPSAPIGHSTITQMVEWEGGRPHPRGLGYIVGEPAAEQEDQGQEPPASPRQPRGGRRVRVSAAGSSRVRTAMSDTQYRRLTRRIDATHDMTRRFATDLIRVLDDMSGDMGFEPHWPEFGAHHPYPPPDSPLEEGGADDA